MGTKHYLKVKATARPKKAGCARRRREKVHRQRLEAFGVDPKRVKRMTAEDVRTLLKRPAKLRKAQLLKKA
jgi:hypothetical protein